MSVLRNKLFACLVGAVIFTFIPIMGTIVFMAWNKITPNLSLYVIWFAVILAQWATFYLIFKSS